LVGALGFLLCWDYKIPRNPHSLRRKTLEPPDLRLRSKHGSSRREPRCFWRDRAKPSTRERVWGRGSTTRRKREVIKETRRASKKRWKNGLGAYFSMSCRVSCVEPGGGRERVVTTGIGKPRAALLDLCWDGGEASLTVSTMINRVMEELDNWGILCLGTDSFGS